MNCNMLQKIKLYVNKQHKNISIAFAGLLSLTGISYYVWISHKCCKVGNTVSGKDLKLYANLTGKKFYKVTRGSDEQVYFTFEKSYFNFFDTPYYSCIDSDDIDDNDQIYIEKWMLSTIYKVIKKN